MGGLTWLAVNTWQQQRYAGFGIVCAAIGFYVAHLIYGLILNRSMATAERWRKTADDWERVAKKWESNALMAMGPRR